jgi:hypothetical protein
LKESNGTDSVHWFRLSFQGDSPTSEANLVGAFTRGHCFSETRFQACADFFQPEFVCFQLLFRAKGPQLQSLQYADQAIHV